MSDPRVVEHRISNGNKAAIVFVHGFGGNPRATWGPFADCLAEDAVLRGWDIFSLGYPTTLLLPDISSLWSAEPELRTVSDEVATRAMLAPFHRYDALAFIAHSMGGLVVQRALVEHDTLAHRVSHVLLFGTPSFGLVKAGLFALLEAPDPRHAGQQRVHQVCAWRLDRAVRAARSFQFSRGGGRPG